MKVVNVRKHCHKDACGGELIGTGMGLSTGWNTTWTNRCNQCGVELGLEHSYPYTYNKYEPEELEEEWHE